MPGQDAAPLNPGGVPAGISLLSGRRRLPHWPLGRWHAAVAGVLRHAHPYEHLETYCVALNNAALIELTLGRADDARALCRLQAARLAEARDWIAFYDRFWSDRLDALEQALAREPSTPSQGDKS